MILRLYHYKNILIKDPAFQIFGHNGISNKAYIELLFSKVIVLVGVVHFTQYRANFRELRADLFYYARQNGLHYRMCIADLYFAGFSVMNLLRAVYGIIQLLHGLL